MTSLVEERVRGEVVALRVCLFREEMRENGLEGEEWCLKEEEEREKREGEKQRARFLASICGGQRGRWEERG